MGEVPMYRVAGGDAKTCWEVVTRYSNVTG